MNYYNTKPEDFIQNGQVITYGADGSVVSKQNLNPQELATDATAGKLLAWLNMNVPEGNKWSLKNGLPSMGNVVYTCSSWSVVASNGQEWSAGLVYYDLFNYPNPTASTLVDLHMRSAADPAS